MANDGIVADASVVAKWYLRDEVLLAQADNLLHGWREGRWSLSAPGHSPYEITGSIMRAVRVGRLPAAAGEAAVIDFAELTEGFTFASPRFIIVGASDLARSLNVNFFDACYLQVARLHGGRLITADEAFYRQAGAQPDVVWLGDFP